MFLHLAGFRRKQCNDFLHRTAHCQKTRKNHHPENERFDKAFLEALPPNPQTESKFPSATEGTFLDKLGGTMFPMVCHYDNTVMVQPTLLQNGKIVTDKTEWELSASGKIHTWFFASLK